MALLEDWHSRGSLCTFGHLYKRNKLKSFEQLRSSFGLPSAHFFKYLQIRDYIRVQQGGKLTPLEDLQIDIMVKEEHNPKGFLSFAYNRLTSLSETN